MKPRFYQTVVKTVSGRRLGIFGFHTDRSEAIRHAMRWNLGNPELTYIGCKASVIQHR